MCGIVGFFNAEIDETRLQYALKLLRHRGPDAQGVYFSADHRVGMGHARLSILDLDAKANQPMLSHCGRYVMVFNGEIYNFKKLKSALSRAWKTDSDTEVILELFVEKGSDFIHLLEGMFAIAIYDTVKNEIHAFRDRLGIKPFYYSFVDNRFCFGSEIKAVRALENNIKFNRKALTEFLHFGFIGRHQTIFESINVLPQGGCLKVNRNQIAVQSYWSLESLISEKLNYTDKEAKTRLEKLIFESVEKRLVSDVPLGTFLSGGIDSSLVTAVVSKLKNEKVDTFTIGFKESKSDESRFARSVAAHLNTNHHELIVTEKDALDQLIHVMDHFDQPYADSSALPTSIVSGLARKHVTVALSGDGGDELFMGYGMHQWAERLNKPLLWAGRNVLASICDKGSSKYKRIGGLLRVPNRSELHTHILSQEQYFFAQREIERLLMIDNKVQPSKLRFNGNLETASERQAFFDMNHYLPDDLLVKVDMASMLYGLEVRVPLLDPEIVKFALNLNVNLKLRGGESKWLLKQVLYDYVPKALFNRPKQGFSIPLEKWLRGELNFLITENLSPSRIEETGIFNPKEVQSILSRFYKGEYYLYNRIWAMVIVQRNN